MEHQDSMSLMTCSFEEELAVRQCLFTKLSGELRNRIYEHLLSDFATQEISLSPFESATPFTDSSFHLRALAQTCHTFRNEYTPLLRTRFTYSIRLPYLRRYLNTFHPAPHADDPHCRRGGKIILKKWYNTRELSSLDILSIIKIIHESPTLEISFERQSEDSSSYMCGTFVIQTLLQNYSNWKHLSQQLSSIGLDGIYLRYHDREMRSSHGKFHHPCCIVVYLDFRAATDPSQGPSLFTDTRARLVTSWILKSGMMQSWCFCQYVAIECEKSNGQGVHYWAVNSEFLTNDRKFVSLKYAFKEMDDGDAMVCEHVIETERDRERGCESLRDTRFPTSKHWRVGEIQKQEISRDDDFEVFEFDHDPDRGWWKWQVWSVPEDRETSEVSEKVARVPFSVIQAMGKRVKGVW